MTQSGDQLIVGDQRIDEQHRQLFALLEKLRRAIIHGDDRGIVGGIIDELTDCLVEHFSAEERLLLARQYPLYSEHKSEHDRLTAEILKIHSNFHEGQITAGFEMLGFLHTCLNEHTLHDDQAYAHFFQGNNFNWK